MDLSNPFDQHFHDGRPAPARAAWFEPTLAELGPVLSVSEHQDRAAAVEAASALPVAARALVWAAGRTTGAARPSASG